MLDSVTEWVTNIVETVGPAGVAFLVAVENVFPPIPSEVILPLAGFVAGRGDANFFVMLIAATIGSVIGALALYGISAAIGPDRLRVGIVRYGRWFGVKEKDLDRAEAWFDRRSNTAVLLGRCVPIIRSIVSVPAGFRRMPLGKFVVLTAIGSTAWNLALIGAGAVLGERYTQVEGIVGLLQGVVILVIVAAVAWFAWSRLIKPRLTASGDLPADEEPSVR